MVDVYMSVVLCIVHVRIKNAKEFLTVCTSLGGQIPILVITSFSYTRLAQGYEDSVQSTEE